MGGRWKTAAIGDVCSFFKGASVPRARMYDSGEVYYLHYGDLYKGHELYVDMERPSKPIPFISDSERIKESQVARDEDIVYVLTSETVEDLGKALMLRNPRNYRVVAGTETTIMRVEDTATVNPAYLNYLIQTDDFKKKLRQYVTGMKVFRVHPRDISRIDVEVPELSVQAKTVALLDSIYAKIALNTRMNGCLEELLDALFDAEVLNAPHDRWAAAHLTDIASYKNGLAMQKFRPDGDDAGLPVLKIKELRQGFCSKDAERCKSDIPTEVKIHDGDLVFSWSGSLLLNFWAGGDAGLNQHLFKVTSNDYSDWFYYLWTKHHMARFIAMAADRATTMGHIKRSALESADVFIPPKEKMQELDSLFEPILSAKLNNMIESTKLAALRDALLPKLMSGEIDVSEVGVGAALPNSRAYGC